MSALSMTRRDFLATLAGGAATAAWPGWASAREPAADLPNVLILHCDELSSWALSCYAPGLKTVPNYGKTVVPTPHIDRLAAEGAIFHNFFTNSAVCTPSRGCLFTGRYPHSHGAYRNDIPMNRDEVTLARVLQSHGYETGYSGKWHLDGPPKPGFMKPDRSMGFEDCRYMFNRGHWKELKEQPNGDPIDPKGYAAIGDEQSFTTDYLASKTIEFISRPRRKPFFYVVSWPDPHPPFTVRAPYMDMYKPDDMPVPNTYRSGADVGEDAEDAPAPAKAAKKAAAKQKGNADRVKVQKAHYCGLVKCIDDNVGRIVGALRQKGLEDRTVIVFTTDHGEYMAEHNLWGKNQWYRTAYQLPFLVRWPKKIKPGTVVDAFVTNVDVQQTVCGLVGVKPGGREQGRDASPLLRGEKAEWEDAAWIHHSSLEGAGLFTPKYELVLKAGGQHMLFDRPKDPEQTKNLADDPACKDVMRAMGKRILQHHEQVASPAVSWLKDEVAKL
ncbi:MAG: sulfatase-like hydrolase/transferase [Planctomycetes bacterium]|nr:sulfatase-like hydrolase/transferase [Planctomycetota bacterium]